MERKTKHWYHLFITLKQICFLYAEQILLKQNCQWNRHKFIRLEIHRQIQSNYLPVTAKYYTTHRRITTNIYGHFVYSRCLMINMSSNPHNYSGEAGTTLCGFPGRTLNLERRWITESPGASQPVVGRSRCTSAQVSLTQSSYLRMPCCSLLWNIVMVTFNTRQAPVLP